MIELGVSLNLMRSYCNKLHLLADWTSIASDGALISLMKTVSSFLIPFLLFTLLWTGTFLHDAQKECVFSKPLTTVLHVQPACSQDTPTESSVHVHSPWAINQKLAVETSMMFLLLIAIVAPLLEVGVKNDGDLLRSRGRPFRSASLRTCILYRALRL